MTEIIHKDTGYFLLTPAEVVETIPSEIPGFEAEVVTVKALGKYLVSRVIIDGESRYPQFWNEARNRKHATEMAQQLAKG